MRRAMGGGEGKGEGQFFLEIQSSSLVRACKEGGVREGGSHHVYTGVGGGAEGCGPNQHYAGFVLGFLRINCSSGAREFGTELLQQ